ncbi:MAG: DUF6468 domain-containing protein [Hyphomonadaceae bacterium]|nr:DUF6468 domain-containing protein [Hyphomonadaceae bacterium]
MSQLYVLAFEGFLALLLIIAIAYCIRLDGKLKALRSGNSRMLEAAKELQSSVIHAENAVTAMRRSADAAGRELQTKIDEARAMTAATQAPAQYLREEPPRDAVRPVDFSLRRRSVL